MIPIRTTRKRTFASAAPGVLLERGIDNFGEIVRRMHAVAKATGLNVRAEATGRERGMLEVEPHFDPGEYRLVVPYEDTIRQIIEALWTANPATTVGELRDGVIAQILAQNCHRIEDVLAYMRGPDA